jgi:predicted RNA-binding protein YlxR (DUF448 family)
MQKRKIPERRCSGCGASFPKKQLIRVVRAPDGTVSLDFTGRKAGRGAYVCPRLDCFVRARKAQRFQRSLEAEIPEELMDVLEAEIRLMETEAAEDGSAAR